MHEAEPLIVRKVAASDKPQWLALWDGYNAFYGRSGASALSSEITESTWSRFFDSLEPVEALVASAGDQLLGLAHYVFHRTTTAVELTCYLQDLFKRQDLRGRCISLEMVEVVCDDSSVDVAQRVYWQTQSTNKNARALYDRIAEDSGFIVYRIALPAG
jgi:RimJ/RimL family protein N-acetyltransferase